MKCHELYRLAEQKQLGAFVKPWMIADAGKFDMGEWGETLEQFHEFGTDMATRGMLRLPFPTSVFEFKMPKDDWDDALQRMSVLCVESTTARDGVMPGEMAIVCYGYGYGSMGWKLLHKDEQDEASVMIGHAGWVRVFIGETAISELIYSMVCCAVCALISRSTRVETIPAPEKLNRRRAAAGKPPIFEYRTVHLPNAHGGGSPIAGNTHASPRLHLRRGHYRHWPTRDSDQIIPVAPCVVGAAENGIVSKHYLWRMARQSVLK